MSFAVRLRAIRLARGFKQKDVAAAIGISEPNYSMYEHGTREPGISKLTKLANVLNVSTDYLLDIVPTEPAPSKYVEFVSNFSEEELKLFSIIFGDLFPIPRALLLQLIMLYANQPTSVRASLIEHLLDIDENRDHSLPALLPQPNLEQIYRALDLFYGYQEALKGPIIKKD